MFICKNTKILYQFYNEIFTWLFKCENEFKDKDLSGYEKKRIYGFLAERLLVSSLIGLEKFLKTKYLMFEKIIFFEEFKKNGGENGMKFDERVF